MSDSIPQIDIPTPAPAPAAADAPAPSLPAAEPLGLSGTLPFRPGELDATLNIARSRGPDAYAKWLRAAADDGYALSGVHAEALAALKANEPLAPGSTGPDTRSPEAQAFDNSSFAPASSPADYKMNLSGLDGDNMAEVSAVDATIRDALFSLHLPASIGGSIAEMGNRSAIAYENLDDAGRQLWAANQRSQLSKMHANVTETVAKIDRLVGHLDPEVAQTMARAGFFDASVITLLAAHFDRLQLRHNMDRR